MDVLRNKQGIQGSLEFIILDFSLAYKVLCRVLIGLLFHKLCYFMLPYVGHESSCISVPFKCLVSGSQNNEFILSKIKGKRERRRKGKKEAMREGEKDKRIKRKFESS